MGGFRDKRNTNYSSWHRERAQFGRTADHYIPRVVYSGLQYNTKKQRNMYSEDTTEKKKAESNG
jgi:hypothetical protein